MGYMLKITVFKFIIITLQQEIFIQCIYFPSIIPTDINSLISKPNNIIKIKTEVLPVNNDTTPVIKDVVNITSTFIRKKEIPKWQTICKTAKTIGKVFGYFGSIFKTSFKTPCYLNSNNSKIAMHQLSLPPTYENKVKNKTILNNTKDQIPIAKPKIIIKTVEPPRKFSPGGNDISKPFNQKFGPRPNAVLVQGKNTKIPLNSKIITEGNSRVIPLPNLNPRQVIPVQVKRTNGRRRDNGGGGFRKPSYKQKIIMKIERSGRTPSGSRIIPIETGVIPFASRIIPIETGMRRNSHHILLNPGPIPRENINFKLPPKFEFRRNSIFTSFNPNFAPRSDAVFEKVRKYIKIPLNPDIVPGGNGHLIPLLDLNPQQIRPVRIKRRNRRRKRNRNRADIFNQLKFENVDDTFADYQVIYEINENYENGVGKTFLRARHKRFEIIPWAQELSITETKNKKCCQGKPYRRKCLIIKKKFYNSKRCWCMCKKNRKNSKNKYEFYEIDVMSNRKIKG